MGELDCLFQTSNIKQTTHQPLSPVPIYLSTTTSSPLSSSSPAYSGVRLHPLVSTAALSCLQLNLFDIVLPVGLCLGVCIYQCVQGSNTAAPPCSLCQGGMPPILETTDIEYASPGVAPPTNNLSVLARQGERTARD